MENMNYQLAWGETTIVLSGESKIMFEAKGSNIFLVYTEIDEKWILNGRVRVNKEENATIAEILEAYKES